MLNACSPAEWAHSEPFTVTISRRQEILDNLQFGNKNANREPGPPPDWLRFAKRRRSTREIGFVSQERQAPATGPPRIGFVSYNAAYPRIWLRFTETPDTSRVVLDWLRFVKRSRPTREIGFVSQERQAPAVGPPRIGFVSYNAAYPRIWLRFTESPDASRGGPRLASFRKTESAVNPEESTSFRESVNHTSPGLASFRKTETIREFGFDGVSTSLMSAVGGIS